MSEETPRLLMPLLQAGQAQKEIDHNEALILIDGLLHLHIEAVQADPPVAPSAGQCWIVGDPPGGAWSGQADAIALWTGGGWRFVAPVPGMRAEAVTGRTLRWSGSSWIDGVIEATSVRIDGAQVIGPAAAAIADPTGGTTIDAEARATVAALLAALRLHGLIAT